MLELNSILSPCSALIQITFNLLFLRIQLTFGLNYSKINQRHSYLSKKDNEAHIGAFILNDVELLV